MIFTAGASGRWDDAKIMAQSLSTGEHRVLIEGGVYARYVPTGHLVYARTGVLLAVPFDLARLEVTGGSVPIGGSVMQTPSGAAQFSFSENGTLVYVAGNNLGAERTLVWVDREGAARPLTAPPRAYLHLRLSPDGLRLAALDAQREENCVRFK